MRCSLETKQSIYHRVDLDGYGQRSLRSLRKLLFRPFWCRSFLTSNLRKISPRKNGSVLNITPPSMLSWWLTCYLIYRVWFRPIDPDFISKHTNVVRHHFFGDLPSRNIVPSALSFLVLSPRDRFHYNEVAEWRMKSNAINFSVSHKYSALPPDYITRFPVMTGYRTVFLSPGRRQCGPIVARFFSCQN